MSRSIWGWLVRRLPTGSSGQGARGRAGPGMPPFVEQLESRDLPSVVQPGLVLFSHGGGATPFGTSAPTGLTPTQIRHAYGFDQISFSNGTVAGDGSGSTIAIVDAYNDPNIIPDLAAFDTQFNLPGASTNSSSSDYVGKYLTVVNQNGGSTLPSGNVGWAQEIALDVEWAHAIAPKANILLVEANNNSLSNLFTAVTTAAKANGVVAVSMSWGGAEFSGEAAYDSKFTTPSGHAGVTFVASSGDSGAPDSYPSASQNVLSVGGTTLNVDSFGNITSESGWSGSGGGLSSQESQPSYQQGLVIHNGSNTVNANGKRANPDVAYDADPNTGFPVYITYGNSVSTPWLQFGGTSAGAPQWAALIAIADQGRALAGLGSLDGGTQTLPKLYTLSPSDFHDIVTGTSTGRPNWSAGPGFDLVTGRGSPVANLIVADLVGQTTTAGLQQGGFETPNVGTGAYGDFAYNPSGSAWTFDNSSGIAGNGSGFTSGNPSAPEGTQVAFLQAWSTFSQSVSLGAGTSDLTFAAAQRANYQASTQTFQVLVDGNSVGTFTPSGTSYGTFTTSNFTVTAGSHTIQFVGLNPNGGDNTAFIDNVQLFPVGSPAAIGSHPTGLKPVGNTGSTGAAGTPSPVQQPTGVLSLQSLMTLAIFPVDFGASQGTSAQAKAQAPTYQTPVEGLAAAPISAPAVDRVFASFGTADQFFLSAGADASSVSNVDDWADFFGSSD